LNACARIVFKSPKLSRSELAWRQNRLHLVQDKMSNFSFLDGYSFDPGASEDPQVHRVQQIC
jgi:hypothetical protein